MTNPIELMARTRLDARRQIVFETNHGCNNNLADEIFSLTWDAALAALKEHYAVVPREPTEEMKQAGFAAAPDLFLVEVRRVYKAMIESGEVK